MKPLCFNFGKVALKVAMRTLNKPPSILSNHLAVKKCASSSVIEMHNLRDYSEKCKLFASNCVFLAWRKTFLSRFICIYVRLSSATRLARFIEMTEFTNQIEY